MRTSPIQIVVLMLSLLALHIEAKAGSLTLNYEIRISGAVGLDVTPADQTTSPLGGIAFFNIECPQHAPPYSNDVRLVNVTGQSVASITVTGVPENTPCAVTEMGFRGSPSSAPYRSPSIEPYRRAFTLGSLGSRTEAFQALWSPPILNQIPGNILRGPDVGSLASITGLVTGMNHDFRLIILNASGYVVFEAPNDPFSSAGIERRIDGEFSRGGVLPDGIYTAVLGGGYPKHQSNRLNFTCFCLRYQLTFEFTAPPEQRLIDPYVYVQSLGANWISTGETASASLMSDGVANGIISNFEIRNGQPSGSLLFSLRPVAPAPNAGEPLAVSALSTEKLFLLCSLVAIVAIRRGHFRLRKTSSSSPK